MIKLLADLVSSDLQKQINESIEMTQKENSALKDRIVALENSLIEQARAISVLALVQSNTLAELKRMLTESKGRHASVRSSKDDDIIN